MLISFLVHCVLVLVVITLIITILTILTLRVFFQCNASSTRDDSLHEAIDMARASSAPALKLIASAKLHTLDEGSGEKNENESPVRAAGAGKTGSGSSNTGLIAAGVAVVAVVLMGAMVVMKGKKN